jgi:predicted DNA binding CopG/RHH family protein
LLYSLPETRRLLTWKGFALINKHDAPHKRAKVTNTAPRPPFRMKRLTLDLPEPLHRAIKKNAAEEGVTMAEKLRALLTKHYRVTEKIR